MNRDLKVGSALGILVIGFAALIMFGQKQEDVVPHEQLREDFADVDAEIALQPHTPHLTGVESSLGTETPSAAPSSSDDVSDAFMRESIATEASATESNKAERERFAWEDNSSTDRGWQGDEVQEPSLDDSDLVGNDDNYDFLNDTDEELYRESAGDRGDVPDPISISSTQSTQLKPNRSGLNRDWVVTSNSPAPQEESENPQRDAGAKTGLSYVIQSGDTLSKIATRYGLRAGEIFAANRDVLNDPNRLRVGVKIVIPRREQSDRNESRKDNGPVADRSRDSHREETVGLRKQNSLFRPVSRTPFTRRTKTLTKSSSSKKYRVRPGDSLERIARKYYGDRSKAREIFQANRGQLSSPNQIRSGMTLILP